MGKKRKGKKAGASKGAAKASGRAGATPAAVGPDERTPPVPAAGIDREELTPVLPPPVSVDAGAIPRPFDDDRPSRSTDRRIFRRVPFFRKVHYRFESLEEFKSEVANDISLGGMFIRTEEPEAIGSVIFLEFDLKDGSKLLRGYGKVVRVNPKGVPDFDAGMGIEFLKFDDESIARIRALIAERYEAK